jgi:thiol-disulfide isomerase/thioredoxin
MKKLIFTIMGLFLFTPPAFAGIKLNEPAPLFSVKDLEGRDFNLADVVGAARKAPVHGVILSFFASWCMPCRNELPLLNSLTDELNKKSIKVVIINVKEDEKTIKALLGDLKVNKPLALSDRNGKVSEKYGVLFLPVTFFIGADGNVKSVIYGEIENEKKLKESTDRIAK